MNIYRIWQDYVTGYDTFDSAVVVAESEEEARQINPVGYPDSSGWCDPKYVQVELIGVAVEGMVKGIVVASFNAG
jgi:hypothetical protein